VPFPSHDITFDGRTQSVDAWARETGIPHTTIRSRLFRLNWPVERALSKLPDKRFRKGGRKRKDAIRPCPELKRHPDGRAVCRWSEGGRERFVTFGAWGSADATRAYRRFALEWAAGHAPTEGGATAPAALVGDVVVKWLEHCSRTYRKRDRETSECHCNRSAMRPLAELYGDQPAAEFDAGRFRAVREAMIERKWVRKTISDNCARIVRAFQWAATENMVPTTVPAALALVEPLVAGRRADVRDPEPIPPAPAADVAAVLDGGHLHPDPARRAVLEAAVRVQLATGMRPGELCALTVGAIDRRREPWRCDLSAESKMLHKELRRVVYFGPKARSALAPLLAAAEERGPGAPLFALPAPRRERVTRVTAERNTESVTHVTRVTTECNAVRVTALTPSAYRVFVAAACKRAGVPAWAPNQLRHTRATEVMDLYEDDGATAAVLGNSPEVARRVYADRPGEAAARRIAEATG